MPLSGGFPPQYNLSPSPLDFESVNSPQIICERGKAASSSHLPPVRPAVEYFYNWLTIPADGLLAQQRASGPDRTRALLDGPLNHAVAAAEVGLQYDSRDSEIVTETGSFHNLRFRFSPHIGPALPHKFGQVNATARVYRPLIPRFLVDSVCAATGRFTESVRG